MIPFDLDPSLHPGEPAPPVLEDGFSAPRADPLAPTAEPGAASLEQALADKSDF